MSLPLLYELHRATLCLWIGFSLGSEGAASANHSSGAALQKRRSQCPSNVTSYHPQQERLLPHFTDGKSEVKSLGQSHAGSQPQERGSEPRLPARCRFPQLAAQLTLACRRPASPSHPSEGRRARPRRSVPRPLIAGRPASASQPGDAPAGLARRRLPGPRDAADWPAVITGTLREGGGAGAAPREHKLCKYPGAARG